MPSPIALADALADIDLDIRLDEALVVPCDMEDGCLNRALWSMRCEGCSEVSFACPEHRAIVDELSTHLLRSETHGVVCALCEHPFPSPVRWLPL